MSNMPWLRLYNETLHDRKIAKIARKTGNPRPLIIGVWVSLLMMASESPERGHLLIGDDMPADWDDLLYEVGLTDGEYRPIHHELMSAGMLYFDECPHGDRYVIANWDKRQFKSDNSTQRVQRYRKKKKEESETLQPKEDETLPKRYETVIESDTDTDTESDQDRSYAAAVTAYEECFGPISAPIISQQLNDWIDEKGLMLVLDALAKSKENGARSFAYTEAILRGSEALPASPVPSLSEVLNPIGTYGRSRYKQMREAVSPEVWAVLEKMGEWTNLCSQSPRDLEFAYKRAIKQ